MIFDAYNYEVKLSVVDFHGDGKDQRFVT